MAASLLPTTVGLFDQSYLIISRTMEKTMKKAGLYGETSSVSGVTLSATQTLEEEMKRTYLHFESTAGRMAHPRLFGIR